MDNNWKVYEDDGKTMLGDYLATVVINASPMICFVNKVNAISYRVYNDVRLVRK